MCTSDPLFNKCRVGTQNMYHCLQAAFETQLEAAGSYVATVEGSAEEFDNNGGRALFEKLLPDKLHENGFTIPCKVHVVDVRAGSIIITYHVSDARLEGSGFTTAERKQLGGMLKITPDWMQGTVDSAIVQGKELLAEVGRRSPRSQEAFAEAEMEDALANAELEGKLTEVLAQHEAHIAELKRAHASMPLRGAGCCTAVTALSASVAERVHGCQHA